MDSTVMFVTTKPGPQESNGHVPPGTVDLRRDVSHAGDRLRSSLRALLRDLLDAGFGLALDTVERLAHSLDEIRARGGVGINALIGAAGAKLAGRSPVLGALAGAFGALSTGMKWAIFLIVLLAVLLLPVTVVLLLLALIVLAIVVAVRLSSR